MADAHSLMIDQNLLRQAADLYAIGADRRDKALWRQVLAEECVIEGPGFITQGRDACLQLIDALDHMYRATRHDVLQQRVIIDEDAAVGETYCAASHLLRDRDAILVWAIRYQDAWRRDDEGWRFTRRSLLLDWTETRPVNAGTSMNQFKDMTL
ncbi:nuclear transport factor 2 family protein [Sphingomonas bisphenolicum]|uniref:SnoaL-like domain-containing protein n=1 Tax=Sphingomonas bisphenolicum TaxID=296544 RepID=A0ABM7G3V5_9SPHN|nr:nuclear transport factor 2 family protein [Sphingomonas bisphenolicum]BBF71939.1 hypothetical protein SBA_ch2_4720 [Sphingomonas bisphenolicum]